MKTQFLNNSKLGIFIFAFVFFATTINAQTTVNNNPNTSADFTDLQTAIDAASNGDIIYLQQSPTSYGTITINKGLTIVGRSHSDSGYKSEISLINFAAGSSNTTLKGLKISSTIRGAGTAATITDLKFFDNDISSITLGSTHTANNVLIQGNIIRSTFNIGASISNVLVNNNIFFSSSLSFLNTATLLFSNNVMSYDPGPTFTNSTTGLLNIDNCIFIGNIGSASTAKFTPGSGTIQVNNCVTYNYDASGTYTFNTGAGITINANNQENVDPLFTSVDPTGGSGSIASVWTGAFRLDGTNDDLTLQGSSTVNDDGLFQGYNFKNFGTPTGIPSIKVDSYSSTVPKNSNLTVTITAKTN